MTVSPPPSPGPGGAIAPPPAPYTTKLPHDLFTLDEVVTALQLLEAGGLAQYWEPRVTVVWANGARQRLLLTELPQLTQIEEIRRVSVYWLYADGSTVSGNLLNRPARGELTVENGPQARAAADRCVESLRVRNQQRATVRGFLASMIVPFLVWALLFAVSTVGQGKLRGNSSSEDLTTESAVTSLTIGSGIGAVLVLLTFLVTRGVRHRFSGTRMAHVSQAHRKVLTNEVAVLAAVLGVPIAVLALLLS